MKKIFKNYGLSIVLAGLFLASWAAQAIFQWHEFINEALQHGSTPHAREFLASFFSATFENWQSEFLQLFAFVVLATYLIHKGSPQSRDGDDRRDAQLDRIEKKLHELSSK